MAAPNIKEIEWAISELEHEESSESRYGLLAALYTCRREMTGGAQPREIAYSEAAPVAGEYPKPDVVGLYGESDFLQEVAGRDPERAWQVIDELMETLKVVNRRTYDGVMRKISRA